MTLKRVKIDLIFNCDVNVNFPVVLFVQFFRVQLD